MTIIVNVLSPNNIVCKDLIAEQVLVPGMEGTLGVFEGHVALMTCLDVGLIGIKKDGKWIPVISNGDGVAEISKTSVTIVGPSFDEFVDLDLDEEKARQEVVHAITNFQDFSSDRSFEDAVKRLKKANAKLAGIKLLNN